MAPSSPGYLGFSLGKQWALKEGRGGERVEEFQEFSHLLRASKANSQVAWGGEGGMTQDIHSDAASP